MINKYAEKYAEYLYLIFRVVIGIIFMLHGFMKMPGIFSGATGISSLMFYAGLIEIIGGALLVLGLFSRYVALIGAIEMLVAFFTVHIAKGLNPLANGGEPAALFFAIFLVLLGWGPGKLSLDNMFKKKA